MNRLQDLQIKKLSKQDQKDLLIEIFSHLSVYNLREVVNDPDRRMWDEEQRLRYTVGALYKDVNNFKIGELSHIINTFILKRIVDMTVRVGDEYHEIKQFDLFDM